MENSGTTLLKINLASLKALHGWPCAWGPCAQLAVVPYRNLSNPDFNPTKHWPCTWLAVHIDTLLSYCMVIRSDQRSEKCTKVDTYRLAI